VKQITFHLDFISPFAYLAFERLPDTLQGLSYSVDYRPVLLAGMLKHHGQLGPAEIAPKREWTYRHVLWLGHSLGVPLQMPPRHPFNPLPHLRLALACGSQGLSNRFACESVFRHIWRGGEDASDPARLTELQARLQPARDPADAIVKNELKINTDDAIARGVFGVPTFGVDGRLFWGLDGLPMLRAYLNGDVWFEQAHWDAIQSLPGTQRPR
jgi:2-hydroxychromene-2-carboxylate isomerase